MTPHSDTRKTVLIFYWFISNRHNPEMFRQLCLLHRQFGEKTLRIVGLNPFNCEEDIARFRTEMQVDFELEPDHRHSGMYYQVNTYPTFILMDASGKIHRRISGCSEDNLAALEDAVKRKLDPPESCREVFFAPEPYKGPLSLKYKNR